MAECHRDPRPDRQGRPLRRAVSSTWSRRPATSMDTYFWIDRPETFNLGEVLGEIRDTAAGGHRGVREGRAGQAEHGRTDDRMRTSGPTRRSWPRSAANDSITSTTSSRSLADLRRVAGRDHLAARPAVRRLGRWWTRWRREVVRRSRSPGPALRRSSCCSPTRSAALPGQRSRQQHDRDRRPGKGRRCEGAGRRDRRRAPPNWKC